MSIVRTVALRGLTGHLLTLTATATDGPPAITLTGGSGPAGHDVRELRDRVYAALANSGQLDRRFHVEVQLDTPDSPGLPSPAAAAVAVAVIAATHAIAAPRLADTAVLGEVGLNGGLHPTLGMLPATQVAREHGIRRVIVPAAALAEAALVDGVEVLGAHSLAEVADWLRGDDTAVLRPAAPAVPVTEDVPVPARGLAAPVLRAVEIAAAGGHHMMLDAVENAGALLVASWLRLLLPDLTPSQQYEVAAIRSLIARHGNSSDSGVRGVGGVGGVGGVLVSTPPMVTIHPSISEGSLLGAAAPGAVSRAHHGLLVASDLDQFTPTVLESLRFVLVQRESRLALTGHSRHYPAQLQLFATGTRTPTGRRPDVPIALLDAIDVRLRLTTPQAAMSPGGENPGQVTRVHVQARARVASARARAEDRWSQAVTRADHAVTNAAVPAEVLGTLPTDVDDPIRHALYHGALSRRGAEVVARLAWTAADLDSADTPEDRHVQEALVLRQGAIPPTAVGPQAR